MKQSDFDKAMLVEFAVREVAGGSLEEMQAVIYCIRNRVRKGWHDGRWVENIENSNIYTAHQKWLVIGKNADDPKAGTLWSPYSLNTEDRNYQRLLNMVDDMYYGQRATGVGWDGKKIDEDAQGSDLESAVGTALYWQFLKRSVRPWFAENIVRDHVNHPVRGQMGMMIFYK